MPEKDAIIADLKIVADKLGHPPKYTEYAVFGTFNEDTVSNKFGSWRDAIAAADLLDEYHDGRPTRIDKEELIDDIQTVAQDLGKTPTKNEYDVLGEYSENSARNRFGSWNEAVEAAGLEPNTPDPPSGPPPNKIDDEDILEDIRRVEADLQKTPSMAEYTKYGKYHGETVKNHFGSWGEGVRQAGFEPLANKREPVSKDELLADLKSVAETLGRTPSWREYNRYGNWASQTISEKFESWSVAVENAGLDPVEHMPGTDPIPGDEVLVDIRSVGEELCKTPTQDEYNIHGEYSATTARNKFGRWNGAIEAAGLVPSTPNQPLRISEEDVLEDLERVIHELGYPPLATDYNEHGEYSAATVRKHFDSWSNAMAQFGYDLNPGERHPLEILADVERVDDMTDGRPTRRDYQEHGKFSVATVMSKWGSWSNALRELGYKGTKSGVEDIDYLHDLVEVAHKVGRPPTHSDYDEYGSMDYRKFMTKFGANFDQIAEEAHRLAKAFSDPEYSAQYDSLEEILS